MAITTNYRFAFNDFEFGGGDSVYQILTIDGLEDLPAIRNQDDNRGYQDGMWTGRDFLSGRTLTFTMTVRGDSNNSMFYYLDLLQRNLIPQQQGTSVLQFKLPNSSDVQRINARVRRRAVQINTDYSSGLATAIYEFFCPDPRYYDDTQKSTNLAGSTAGTIGRTYDRTYLATSLYPVNPNATGMSYGGGTSTQNLITNDGWATTYPVITITGSAAYPRIDNLTAGTYLSFNTTLTPSQTMVIDTGLRTITINGITSRAVLDNNSTWFAAPPGTSIWKFTAGLVDGNTTCTVVWRNAYI